jgi:putative two-component system response regulator
MKDIKSAQILVVDDQDSNVLLIKELLARAGYTRVAATTNSTDVEGLFITNAPDLLLLDLQMPDPDGFAVMKLIERWTMSETYVPVLVLTADAHRETRRQALEAGARDFLTKPFDADEVFLRIENLLRTRLLQLQLQSHNEVLDAQVQHRTRELERSRIEAYEKLALAAEYRDDDTGQHTRRVGTVASALAGALGVNRARLAAFSHAAALHDLGKIGVPDAILLKPGKLTDEELATMHEHPRIGSDILSGSSSPLFALAAEIALTHHERWDGSGYPRGLAGQSIPRAGRIVALADAFDAMSHDRPYKPAMELPDVLAEIDRCAGTHFDPTVVGALGRLDPDAILGQPHETVRPLRLQSAAPTSVDCRRRAPARAQTDRGEQDPAEAITRSDTGRPWLTGALASGRFPFLTP